MCIINQKLKLIKILSSKYLFDVEIVLYNQIYPRGRLSETKMFKKEASSANTEIIATSYLSLFSFRVVGSCGYLYVIIYTKNSYMYLSQN